MNRKNKDTDNSSVFQQGPLYEQLVSCLFLCCALIKAQQRLLEFEFQYTNLKLIFSAFASPLT